MPRRRNWEKLKEAIGRCFYVAVVLLLFSTKVPVVQRGEDVSRLAAFLDAIGYLNAIGLTLALAWIAAPFLGAHFNRLCSMALLVTFGAIGVVGLKESLERGAFDPSGIPGILEAAPIPLAVAGLFGAAWWAIEHWAPGALKAHLRKGLGAAAILSVLVSPMLGGAPDTGWIAFCLGFLAILLVVAVAYDRIDKAGEPPEAPAP